MNSAGLVGYQSLFAELNVNSTINNVDNLIVNQNLDLTNATVTGPVANWSALQSALDTLTNGKVNRSGDTMTGDLLVPEVDTDTINEKTTGSGVTVSGVLIKSGLVAGQNISTMATNITTNTTNIATNTTNIATNTANISTNTSHIATNTTNIATNTTNIATNAGHIATNTTNIATNTSNITAVTTTANNALQISGSNHMTGALLAASGLVGTPSLTFNSDSATGFYWISSGNLGITTSGVLRATISTTAITPTIPFTGSVGSVSAPPYSFTGNTNTGIYSSASNNIDFATNGVRCCNMNTTNIQNMIDIVPSTNSARSLGSSSLCYSNMYTDFINFANNSTTSSTTVPNKIQLWSNGSVYYGMSVLSSTLGFVTPSSSNFNFYSGGTLYFQISTTNVNTAVPFILPAGSVSAPSLTFSGNTTNGIFSSATNNIDFATNGVNRMNINSSAVTITSTQVIVPVGSNVFPTYTFSGDTITGMYWVSSGVIGFSCSDTLTFQIGTTNCVSKLHIIPFAHNTFDLGTTAVRWRNVYCQTGAFNGSDRRLKNTVTDLSDELGLSFVNALRPVTFKWNDDEGGKHTRTHIGLIAQEVEQEIYKQNKTLEDVDIVSNSYLIDNTKQDAYLLKYDALIPCLIKSVQQLSERVAFLETLLDSHITKIV